MGDLTSLPGTTFFRINSPLEKKNYPSTCCNELTVIIKCCHGNTHSQTCLSITKSVYRSHSQKMKRKNQEQSREQICVLESGFHRASIWSPQRRIQNLILSRITLNGAKLSDQIQQYGHQLKRHGNERKSERKSAKIWERVTKDGRGIMIKLSPLSFSLFFPLFSLSLSPQTNGQEQANLNKQ